jgi:hypothetical protein
MRATKAYIASAGTAAVMLGASVCVFALVSAFMAFGAWPGSDAHTTVDQLVLRDVQRTAPAKVTVRRDALAVARRAAKRAARRAAHTPALRGTSPLAGVRGNPAAPGSAAQPHKGSGPTLPGTPAVGGTPQVPDVAKGVDQTAADVTTKVQTQIAPVTKQVDEVIRQVGAPVAGGSPPPPVNTLLAP